MIKLFRSLFGSQQQMSSVEKVLIEEMTFDEIINFIKNKKESIHTKELINCLKRLYEIALWDNHVPDQKREMALQLTDAIMQDLEESLTDNPDALAAIKEANKSMIENTRIIGYGSLSWKINEESIPSEDIVAYAMRPEHRHLVPDFLTTMREENLENCKREFVKQIILSEDYEGMNAVIIIHGLAAKGDKAVAALLTPTEFNALLNVPTDYTAGRNVLVSLGLLPKESGARPFKPLSEAKGLVAYMIKSRKEDDEKDPRLEKLTEEEKTALLIALNILRIVLARCHLQQIYGKEIADQVMEIFKSPIVKEGIELISKVQKMVMERKPDMPIDLIILDQFLPVDGQDVTTEEGHQDLQPYLYMASDWINHERVYFQTFFRFMLRAAGDPVPEIKSDIDQELVNYLRVTYRLKGANSSLPEKWMNFEDWIGTQ